jgi:hypothetical protein
LSNDVGVVQGGSVTEVFAGFEKALKQHRIWAPEAQVGKILTYVLMARADNPFRVMRPTGVPGLACVPTQRKFVGRITRQRYPPLGHRQERRGKQSRWPPDCSD